MEENKIIDRMKEDLEVIFNELSEDLSKKNLNANGLKIISGTIDSYVNLRRFEEEMKDRESKKRNTSTRSIPINK